MTQATYEERNLLREQIIEEASMFDESVYSFRPALVILNLSGET